ncbi:MAG: phosphate acyltransferase PlsX [Halocynthiibacter sp.]
MTSNGKDSPVTDPISPANAAETVTDTGLSSVDPIVISVDAMGGDLGPKAVIEAVARSARKNDRIAFILHGDEKKLKKYVKKARITDRCEIRGTEDVVRMDDKPSQVLRSGKNTSMWSTIEAVRNGEAKAAVSCGNTGALMAMSMIRLRKLPGIKRPAISCLWPSRNPQGSNVLLDVGADVRADAEDLMQYALMGASYARNGLGLRRPRVGLLNVGSEDTKGHSELKEAHELINQEADHADINYIGFVEGNDFASSKVDVIVTDGFTGNIALKTGEGTAMQLAEYMREAFKHSLLSRLGALFVLSSLKRLKKRMDPRRHNGGVFLGLNGTVVKSHGSSDALGTSTAIKLAFTLAENRFDEKLAARVASVEAARQDAKTDA